MLPLAGCRPAATPADGGGWQPVSVRYAERFSLARAEGPEGARWRITVHVPTGDTVVNYSIEVGDTGLGRLACGSTTQLGLVVALDARSRVVGITDTQWVYDAALRARVATGLARATGEGATSGEALAAARPDLVLPSAAGVAQTDAHHALRELGLRVLPVADWLEAHPLGRAEWLRVMGILTGRAAQADRLFSQVVMRYDSLTRVAWVSARPRPTVVTGRNYKGVWYVPAGGSYWARLLSDAGYSYPWQNEKGVGSLALGPERVVQLAGGAEVWLNPDEFTSRGALVREDARYGAFAAYRAEQVWNKTLRMTAAGGNDFWELGTARPDLVLADLIAIARPGLLPDHRFTFYQKLGP